MEGEGGSATLDFLKEHERKIKEKADINKVIDRNEKRLKAVKDEIYGVAGSFMDQKVLLGKKVPILEQ